MLFDKVHTVYEMHLQGPGKRGASLHTLYILYQLLVLMGRKPILEEFNHLGRGSFLVTQSPTAKPSNWPSPTTKSGSRSATTWDGASSPPCDVPEKK